MGLCSFFYSTAGPIAEPKIAVTRIWDDREYSANDMGSTINVIRVLKINLYSSSIYQNQILVTPVKVVLNERVCTAATYLSVVSSKNWVAYDPILPTIAQTNISCISPLIPTAAIVSIFP